MNPYEYDTTIDRRENGIPGGNFRIRGYYTFNMFLSFYFVILF